MAEYRTPTVEEMQEEGTIFEALVPYPLKKGKTREEAEWVEMTVESSYWQNPLVIAESIKYKAIRIKN